MATSSMDVKGISPELVLHGPVSRSLAGGTCRIVKDRFPKVKEIFAGAATDPDPGFPEQGDKKARQSRSDALFFPVWAGTDSVGSYPPAFILK